MEKHFRLKYALLEIDVNEGIDYKIANEILSLINKGEILTLKKISFNSYVSNATINRFCKRLKLSGFKELKTLADLEIKHNTVDRLHEESKDWNKLAINDINELWTENKTVITKLKKINKGNKINILTTANYLYIANAIKDVLSKNRMFVSIFCEASEWELSNKIEADHVIGLSMSNDRLDLIKIFREHLNPNRQCNYIYISAMEIVSKESNYFIKIIGAFEKYKLPKYLYRKKLYQVLGLIDYIFSNDS